MALATLGGRLLVQAGRLAESLACCCVRWCRQTGQDACGNTTYACSTQQEGSLGPCTPECSQPPDPCECGPNVPCPPCYECVDRKCVRTENCCADGAQCPPCATCVNGTCVPCGECQQCIYGVCSPCGECQKCDGGDCVPCGSGEVCIGGVCVPKQYYCCWDSCADKTAGTNNTTCKEATVSGSSQTSPCGEGTVSGGTGGATCDLTKSGPHNSLAACQSNCQKYKCVPDACGGRECVPDPTGPYGSLSACQAGCPQDPCSTPCSFSGASGPGFYSIDACRRELCINFVSLESRPMRVAIFAPELDANCNVVAASVEQVDSGWRGEECCDCAARVALGGTLAGGATGSLRWTKPRGIQSFEVRVYMPCGGEYEMDIQCNPNPPLPGGGFAGDAECAEMPPPEKCPCNEDLLCADDCVCCGTCHPAPCDCCGGGSMNQGDPRWSERQCCPEGKACCGYYAFGPNGACYECSDLNDLPGGNQGLTSGCSWFAGNPFGAGWEWYPDQNDCSYCDMNTKLGCHCPDATDACGDPSDPANWKELPGKGGRYCFASCQNALP